MADQTPVGPSQDLRGQSALIVGVANKRSIAWAVAQRLAACGVRPVLSYAY